MLHGPRVFLVGSFGLGALERSYRSAFLSVGCVVEPFDLEAAVQRYCRLGGLGRRFNRFVPVEAWIQKANRQMVLAAAAFAPDLVLVLGQNPVRAGALAQLRTMQRVRTGLIWPDTLLNLSGPIQACLPLYDYTATYSRDSVRWLEQLGAPRVEWVPLAADPEMHALPDGAIEQAFRADVGFIGSWRPERELALSHLIATAPRLRIKIWGPDWARGAKGNRNILSAWQGRSLFHGEFAKAVAGCRVSLNIIDPTNFPAANMRFFEIPIAGGCQVSSACPEMEEDFLDGETVVYFRTLDELTGAVEVLVRHADRRDGIASAASALVRQRHTYAVRALQVLAGVSLSSSTLGGNS